MNGLLFSLANAPKLDCQG